MSRDMITARLAAFDSSKRTLWVFGTLTAALATAHETCRYYEEKGILFTYMASARTIQFPEGGSLRFDVLEPVEKFQGLEFHAVDQHDSLREVSPRSWALLTSRVRR